MNVGGASTLERHQQDRQNLLTRLLDAVKQCQVRFGGRTELATDTDSRISCLCTCWEAALQHGMRHSNRALATLKQVTELTGLTKASNVGLISNIKNMETEPVFWDYVKRCLSKHEMLRYSTLKAVTTDAGRGRAWLRSTFNEHSLEKYLHMLLEDEELLKQYYEDWAFLRDQERSSMLPMMAAGLGSILFAINIDNEDLNTIRPASGISNFIASQTDDTSFQGAESDLRPVIAGESEKMEKRKEKKRKKKVAKLVSFDEEESSIYSASPSSALTSPLLPPVPGQLEQVYETSAVQKQKAPRMVVASSTASKGHTRSISDGQQVVTMNSTSNQMDNISLPDTSIYDSKHITVKRDALHIPSDSQSVLASSAVKHGVPVCSPKDIEYSSDQSFSKQSPDGSSMKDEAVSFDCDIYPSVTGDNNSLDSVHSRSSGNSANMDNLLPQPSEGNSFMTTDSSLEEQPIMSDLVPLKPDGSIQTFSIPTETEEATLSNSWEDVSPYGADTQDAAFALQMAQEGLKHSEKLRTQGDGVSDPTPKSPSQETMSSGELRQAIVAMMLRKDEVEEQNRMLTSVLDQEQERSVSLKAELEEMKQRHLARTEQDSERLKALTRENDLLKHQLKKYVSAVQLLRSQGSSTEGQGVELGIHLEDAQPNIPPEKPRIDYSFEASEYEKKLVQVAEMHGELMEFNELIRRQLIAKEAMITRLNQELVSLRGPLPEDLHLTERPSTSIETESNPLTGPLVNLWIPSAFLKGTRHDSFHVYQIFIRIRDEEWTVYRRYAQFHDLHQRLKSFDQSIKGFDFPPKKSIGHKNTKFVEERRQRLQTYLRKVLNYMATRMDGGFTCKQDLLTAIPFFGDMEQKKGKKAKVKEKKKKKKEEAPTEHLPG